MKRSNIFIAIFLFFQLKCLVALLHSLQSEKFAPGINGEGRSSYSPTTDRVAIASVPYQVLVTGKVFGVTVFGGSRRGNERDGGQPAVRVSIFNPTGVVTSSASDFSVEVNCFNMVVSAADSCPCDSKCQKVGGVVWFGRVPWR